LPILLRRKENQEMGLEELGCALIAGETLQGETLMISPNEIMEEGAGMRLETGTRSVSYVSYSQITAGVTYHITIKY
jgi:hypothetical protein